jgi:NitT/TauT family transport system ATP-binding protein
MIPSIHIRVADLRVSYDNQEVIHGISFNVQRGEFLSILGKSGCGKSSLLHSLAGFIKKGGMVKIPARVGMIFQNYANFPWLTVEENVAFGLDSVNKDKREELVTKYLEMVGLLSEAAKYPYELSGGQAQRVALARTLAPDPEVILMDEPFGALDEFTREKMQNWLLDLFGKSHTTIVFVTHNLEEALYLSDRIIVLGKGRILSEYNVPFTRPRNELLKFSPQFIELKRQMFDDLEKSS